MATKLSMPGYWPFRAWPIYGLVGWHWPVFLLTTGRCRVETPAVEDRVFTVPEYDRSATVPVDNRAFTRPTDDRAFTRLADDRTYEVWCGD
jgi:hypothetical protein